MISATPSSSGTPYTSTTQSQSQSPSSRSPAVYHLSPLMRTIRYFTGSSVASSTTSVTPFSQQSPPPNPLPLTPQSPPQTSSSKNQLITRSSGVTVYRPPDYPSSLFRSHYVEPDAVYEEDEYGNHTSSNERSSAGSYLTRSVYDSRFPSTNTADDEVFNALQPGRYINSQEVRNDIENEIIISTNQENINLLNNQDIQDTVSSSHDGLISPSNIYSDRTSDLENQGRTSELEEEIVSRVPNSVFQQQSGHLSVHNLLRISSVGTGWDETNFDDSINIQGNL